MNFAKFTCANDQKININLDLVESYGTITERTYSTLKEKYLGMTYIIPAGTTKDEDVYIVRETEEEIDRTIAAIKSRN